MERVYRVNKESKLYKKQMDYKKYSKIVYEKTIEKISEILGVEVKKEDFATQGCEFIYLGEKFVEENKIERSHFRKNNRFIGKKYFVELKLTSKINRKMEKFFNEIKDEIDKAQAPFIQCYLPFQKLSHSIINEEFYIHTESKKEVPKELATRIKQSEYWLEVEKYFPEDAGVN